MQPRAALAPITTAMAEIPTSRNSAVKSPLFLITCSIDAPFAIALKAHPTLGMRPCVPFIWDPSPSWSLLNLPVQSIRLSHDEPRVDFDRGVKPRSEALNERLGSAPGPRCEGQQEDRATRGLTTLTHTIIPSGDRRGGKPKISPSHPVAQGWIPFKASANELERTARRDRFQVSGERAFSGFHWPSKTGRSRSLLAVGTASAENAVQGNLTTLPSARRNGGGRGRTSDPNGRPGGRRLRDAGSSLGRADDPRQVAVGRGVDLDVDLGRLRRGPFQPEALGTLGSSGGQGRREQAGEGNGGVDFGGDLDEDRAGGALEPAQQEAEGVLGLAFGLPAELAREPGREPDGQAGGTSWVAASASIRDRVDPIQGLVMAGEVEELGDEPRQDVRPNQAASRLYALTLGSSPSRIAARSVPGSGRSSTSLEHSSARFPEQRLIEPGVVRPPEDEGQVGFEQGRTAPGREVGGLRPAVEDDPLAADLRQPRAWNVAECRDFGGDRSVRDPPFSATRSFGKGTRGDFVEHLLEAGELASPSTTRFARTTRVTCGFSRSGPPARSAEGPPRAAGARSRCCGGRPGPLRRSRMRRTMFSHRVSPFEVSRSCDVASCPGMSDEGVLIVVGWSRCRTDF